MIATNRRVFGVFVFCAIWCLVWSVDDLVEKKPLKSSKKSHAIEGAVRLIGSDNSNEGNVEIFHNSKWGNICDDEWDLREGHIVCQQLGFSGVKRITHSSYYGVATRRIWMDDMQCSGNETLVSDCKFGGWGKSDCDATEGAGVVCLPTGKVSTESKTESEPSSESPKQRLNKKYDIDIRLFGGRNDHEGRVEVRVNKPFKKGQWGSICANGWSLLEANVVCKSLNLGYASHAMHTDIFNAELPADVILSDTECYGNETSLAECIHDKLGSPHCMDGANVAAVVCKAEMADLVFDYSELIQSAHLEDRPLFFLQCAMEENCLASEAYVIQRESTNWRSETRRLLKFTARTLNAGSADFRPSIPKHLWQWHLCHQHYHSMEVFATFNIYNSTMHRVAEGHKASFCLEDNQCLPDVAPRYDCANFGDQGISVNCSDIYRFNIDCQWVDISELDTGTYTIKISINPEFKVGEMSFDNNAARCSLLYTETYARIFDCVLERP